MLGKGCEIDVIAPLLSILLLFCFITFECFILLLSFLKSDTIVLRRRNDKPRSLCATLVGRSRVVS